MQKPSETSPMGDQKFALVVLFIMIALAATSVVFILIFTHNANKSLDAAVQSSDSAAVTTSYNKQLTSKFQGFDSLPADAKRLAYAAAIKDYNTCKDTYGGRVVKVESGKYIELNSGCHNQAQVILANNGNSWVQVSGTGKPLTCDNTAKYKIPASVAPTCTDSTGNAKPNPTT